MAPEFEEAAEFAQDHIREELTEESEGQNPDWIRWVGLSTMVMALFVALGALMVGFTAEELLIERTEEILLNSEREADRLEMNLLKTKHAILISLGDTLDQEEIEKISEYHSELGKLENESRQEKSKEVITLSEDKLFAIGVTLLSVALTLSGMAIIIRSRKIWGVGIFFAIAGIVLLVLGLFQMFS